MKKPPVQTIDLQMDEVQALLERARASMSPDDYARLEAMVETLLYLLEVLEDKRTTIDRLRKLLFGSGSEKTRDVIKPDAEGAGPARDAAASPEHSDPNCEASKRKGHGRNGADAYTGAEKVRVPCESLKPGDPCPDCKKGKVYEMAQPGVLVRIVGQAPVQARVYELQKLRCNLCGKIFTAPAPPGVGDEKYDATAAGMIAVLKYGSGLPFNRLEGLQGSLGIPLPASTQWDIINDAATVLAPVHEELIRQAAQGEVLHNDDTTMTILELTGNRARARALAAEASACAEDAPDASDGAPEHGEGNAESAGAEPRPSRDKPERKGVFTSGVVSVREGRRIALFFTGREHAGENLAKVLAQRAAALAPPIQMCDALSRNLPGELQTILGHCLAHGRRQFVDVVERFPDECRTILETLAEVYRNDAVAKEQGLSKEARLEFHQSESGPMMAKLKAWFLLQFEERLVEPNSALGQAIAYMLRHWERLTLFLRVPGAPLDNNVCERALKKAILHRKNAMFYLTEHGAQVGDLFMSLIHTCQLGGVNPFDYLTTLQQHAADLALDPARWMPWNYRDESGQ